MQSNVQSCLVITLLLCNIGQFMQSRGVGYNEIYRYLGRAEKELNARWVPQNPN